MVPVGSFWGAFFNQPGPRAGVPALPEPGYDLQLISSLLLVWAFEFYFLVDLGAIMHSPCSDNDTSIFLGEALIPHDWTTLFRCSWFYPWFQKGAWNPSPANHSMYNPLTLAIGSKVVMWPEECQSELSSALCWSKGELFFFLTEIAQRIGHKFEVILVILPSFRRASLRIESK